MTRVLRSTTKKIQSKVDLSSKLSIRKKAKTIKRTGKKAVEVKKKDNQKSDIWNINTILSNIFAYTDHENLLKFSTVCKKWNNITNPIIRKTIKLNRNWDIINQVHDKRLKNHAKIGADVIECISNNAKHAHLVKELNFNHSLKPQRAIEVFETFKFINKLTVESCEMSQDQFIGMVSPLTQLQELTLSGLDIKRIIYKRLYKEAAQLPSSLKKLSLSVRLIDNPDLFIRTINSHRNLVEFRCSNSNYIFLEPFYKSYKNLLKFEYLNDQLQSPESLIKVFEQNQQLISLKLNLKFWSSELTSYISSQLINLEELSLTEYGYYYQDYTNIFIKFSQPTKIKKLNLEWLRMSNCSLDSILLNCPQLEELALNRINSCQQPNTEILINLCKSAKIKKLSIDFQNLKGPILETLLSSCYHLNELVIYLPIEWKEAIKLIYEKCENLQRLYISPPIQIYGQEMDTFLKEFYQTELFTNNSKCNSTLTHLFLSRFKAADSKAEYFKSFKSLKSITYLNQYKSDYNNFNQKIDINMDLWHGYKLSSKYDKYHYDVELKRS